MDSSSFSVPNVASLAQVTSELTPEPIPSDPMASPFRTVVDPSMRLRLRKSLSALVESHDAELARYIAEGTLTVENYKEYVELFARSLRDTLSAKDGVAYLLESCGFDVDPQGINLQPETRWRVTRETL
jgi:hypothetical protein